VDEVELGTSGIRVSRVGLGCNNFGGRIDFDATKAVVEQALEAGITFFDTAEVYGQDGASERFLGELLDGRRESVVLATKFGWAPERGFGDPARVRAAIEGSLERLRTDHVDLYYLHKPDPDTPIGETLQALDELVREGRVRALGCSNFSAEQLAEAERVARELGTARFVAVQNEYNLLTRNDDEGVLPLCRELGIAYVPYFPLASGMLTGKYRSGEPAPEGTRLAGRVLDEGRLARAERLGRYAEKRGHTLLELALSALVATPGVASVIAGATKPEQVLANVAAAAAWRLDAEDLRALEDV